MAGLMKKQLGRKALQTSVRSLHLLREFGKGENLALPETCTLEFPDAPKNPDADPTADKYKKFILHYRPESGLYAGGSYRLMFDVSSVPDYPNAPPHVRCLTKLWHPNITPEGQVCHNLLKAHAAYGQEGWTPALKMEGLVQALLTMFDEKSDSFSPDDPLNTEAAKTFADERSTFDKKVREWVREYARPVDIPPHCLA